MINNVIKVYKVLNNKLVAEKAINNKLTRNKTVIHLETKLQDYNIICDETNNSPDIIDACICTARVQWLNKNSGFSYVDLIFGTPEQIELTNNKMNLL